MKKIVLWGLGALLLLASAPVIFLATAEDDFYRWAMRQAIEGTIDREIRADGSFSFDIGPEPTLIVTDVWVENAPWAEKKEMARAKRVEVQVALEPLFSGIVRLPRLVVEGLDLDLETSLDGQSNWEFAGAGSEDDGTAVPEDLIYPLLEFISLKDITVRYNDHQSGRETEILLDFLQKEQRAGVESIDIQGEGSINQRSFQITGRFGSIEKALAATEPYPLELMLQTSGLVADLTGTVRNLPAAEGFDLGLTVRTPSIGEVLRTLEIEVPLVGLAEASARLRGNLELLAVEDIDLEVIERSGAELHAEGRLADLMKGQGLDLHFTGKLGPEALRLVGDLPPGLGGVLEGVARADLVARMTGPLEAPAVEEFGLRLEHGSGAELSLQGHGALDFSKAGAGPKEFQVTTLLSLPDPSLLEQALGAPFPDLGAIDASAELVWAGDWVTLRLAEVEVEALEELQLHAEGPIGKLSGTDFAFELEPQVDLSVAIDHSRPVVYLLEELVEDVEPMADPSLPPPEAPATGTGDDLVLLIQRGLESAGLDPGFPDGKMGPRTRAAIQDYQARHDLSVDGRATEHLLRHLQGIARAARGWESPSPHATPPQDPELAESLPELGPITAAARLSREESAYRFDDLRITFGAEDALQGDITGTLGALRPDRHEPLEEIELTVSFALPSSQAFSKVLPSEVPEFKKVRGRFDVRGTTETLSIFDAQVTAEGPDGLAATAIGQVAELSLATGFTMTGLALDLDARWPDTASVYRLADLDLPDLGPVWARATLRDSGKAFSLSGINVKTGPPDQPTAQVTGEIGDLLAFGRVELTGDFDVATTTLLGMETVAGNAEFGKVRGWFELSDTDGSIGIEALSAEIEDAKLLSLSTKGLFDDIKQGDDLRMEATLTVPDVSQLGREFGFEAEQFGSLSFKGEVAGSDEHFLAEGEARLGETDVTGKLSGTLKGERPALRAELHSPLFRLADVGLVPEADAPQADVPQADAPEPTPELATEGEPRVPTRQLVFNETPIPFEALKQFDLDLDVLLEDLEGVHLDIDKAEARLDVVDGVMRIDPLSFNFVGGRVDLTLLADARGEVPELHLELAADDVDLGDLLSQSEVDVPLDGELDLVIDLKAAGQSPRALASSLDGEFGLAIQRGQVRTGLLRLTTTNPVSWLFTESARKGYSDMNCLILRFDVQDGVAESQVLLLDTPNILALGEGSIDLRNEFIDLAFSPRAKKKRLIAMSTPFGIQGPLTGPSVNVSTAGTSVRTVGEVLFSPINMLGSVLPLVSDRGKDKDNPCLVLDEGLSPE
jgi:uncharacterized protein involved in outer membrane biogenesis/peptidoglycan hydrolase-like protein with peptidoglycan-binding domain